MERKDDNEANGTDEDHCQAVNVGEVLNHNTAKPLDHGDAPPFNLLVHDEDDLDAGGEDDEGHEVIGVIFA